MLLLILFFLSVPSALLAQDQPFDACKAEIKYHVRDFMQMRAEAIQLAVEREKLLQEIERLKQELERKTDANRHNLK